MPRRGQVQRTQPLDHPGDAALGVPGGQLAGHRGDLDGHVVDVGPLDQRVHPREPRGRLALAEHRLAQQVEVEPEALRARRRQVRREARAVVGDQVADEAAQPLRARRARRRRAARVRRAPRRRASRGRAGRGSPTPAPAERPASSRAATRTSCGRATRSTNRTASSSPAGSDDEGRQPPGGAPLAGRLALRRRGQPGPGQPDRVLRDVVRRRHAAPRSARRPGCGRALVVFRAAAGSGLGPVWLSRTVRATSVARMPVDLPVGSRQGERVRAPLRGRADATVDPRGIRMPARAVPDELSSPP